MQTPLSRPNQDTDAILKLIQSEIAAAAYHLYLERGSQNGHELDDWIRAEQLLAHKLSCSASGDSDDL
ncbi:MAG: DUF2934 domain-containing protein [Verrucomicrobia bacterium]|nr:DUF2934 domain-containing protein [Verrucomicrobiota bacterium]